jgi:hypothetical protein
LILEVSMRLYQAAEAVAPAGLPDITQLLRPMTKGRIACSQALCRLPDYAACAVSNSLGSVYFLHLPLRHRGQAVDLLSQVRRPGSHEDPYRRPIEEHLSAP